MAVSADAQETTTDAASGKEADSDSAQILTHRRVGPNGCSKSESRIEFTCAARDRFEGCSDAQLDAWRLFGLGMLTFFGASYYLVPLVSFVLPLWVLYSRMSTCSLVCSAIWLFLAFCPNPQLLSLLYSRLYEASALYLDAEILMETSPKKLAVHPKPILYLFYPHGVISYGGWCFGTLCKVRPFKSAAANILLHLPILRQILGQFGVCDGSRSSLRHMLKDKKTNVCLYPGGLAELFLCDFDHERLFFDHRKGCIKLAMESGADVNVTYLFGNTILYKLLLSGLAAKLSRATRISLTVFWGRYFTPIPFQTKIVSVTSGIIAMPDMSNKSQEISSEDIAFHHARVKAEITRIFDTYKHRHPEYAKKELTYA